MSGLEKYEKICDIGKGSFGTVCKVKRKADGRTLVWKELNYGKMSEKEKQMIVSEVNILRELRHPNIVKYYDRIIDREQAKIYIIMEYCEGGDIATLIKNSKKEKQNIPEEIIWSVLSQMIAALGACHNRKEGKILHRDLKPGNIFLDQGKNVKLGDFGLSRVMNQDSVFAYTHVGTPYYMSPEQINDQKYNEKSDIWSTGCIIYEVAALRAPFEATTHYQLAMKIKSGKLDRIPAMYSDDLMSVIGAMIQQEPDKRPSVDQLMQHQQIQVRVKEAKLRQAKDSLKRRDAELGKKEAALKEKDAEIESKKVKLREQEQKLMELEQQIEEQERQLDRQFAQLENEAVERPSLPRQEGSGPSMRASLERQQLMMPSQSSLPSSTKNLSTRKSSTSIKQAFEDMYQRGSYDKYY